MSCLYRGENWGSERWFYLLKDRRTFLRQNQNVTQGWIMKTQACFITPPQLQNLNPLKAAAVEMMKSLMTHQTCGIKEKLKKRMTQERSQSTIIFWLLDPKSATSSDLQSLLYPKGTDSYFLCVGPIFQSDCDLQKNPEISILLYVPVRNQGNLIIEKHNEKKTCFPELANHIVEITTTHLLASPIMKEK